MKESIRAYNTAWLEGVRRSLKTTTSAERSIHTIEVAMVSHGWDKDLGAAQIAAIRSL